MASCRHTNRMNVAYENAIKQHGFDKRCLKMLSGLNTVLDLPSMSRTNHPWRNDCAVFHDGDKHCALAVACTYRNSAYQDVSRWSFWTQLILLDWDKLSVTFQSIKRVQWAHTTISVLLVSWIHPLHAAFFLSLMDTLGTRWTEIFESLRKGTIIQIETLPSIHMKWYLWNLLWPKHWTMGHIHKHSLMKAFFESQGHVLLQGVCEAACMLWHALILSS